jgi:hypothetical protein
MDGDPYPSNLPSSSQVPETDGSPTAIFILMGAFLGVPILIGLIFLLCHHLSPKPSTPPLRMTSQQFEVGDASDNYSPTDASPPVYAEVELEGGKGLVPPPPAVTQEKEGSNLGRPHPQPFTQLPIRMDGRL